jgi:hypothetical protein
VDKFEEMDDVDSDEGTYTQNAALQWDPSSNTPRLSWSRAIWLCMGTLSVEDKVDVLIEWTLTRKWAILSKTVPDPTEEEKQQLGKDLFAVQAKTLENQFKSVYAQRNTKNNEEYNTAFLEWKVGIERQLADEAFKKMVETRHKLNPRLEELDRQLSVLRMVKEAGGEPDRTKEPNDEKHKDTLNAWKGKKDWHRELKRPSLRLPKIKDFMSVPYRSNETKEFLNLLRNVHTAADDKGNGVYGSAYSSSWPEIPTPASTPADHVVPVRWFSGTRLLIETGNPAQLPAVVLARLTENSAKGDDALGLFLPDNETSTSGQGLYTPSDVSIQKKNALAKTICWVFGLYPLISNRKTTSGVQGYSNGGTGVSWYARSWEHGTLKSRAYAKATAFERRVNFLTASMPQWGVSNPLVFHTSGLKDMENMILKRFRGQCSTARLVDACLLREVVGAPE